MEIEFAETALEDLKYWKNSRNTAIQNKINALLQNILDTPFKGIGKPEPLKNNLQGYWSRRINKEHRIVYEVQNAKIIIISMRFHYV